MDTSTTDSTMNISNLTNATSATPYMNGEVIYSKVFRLILLTIIMIVSLVGNTLVIYITCNNKFMRTFAYFLIANLAVADVLSTLVLPFMIYYMEIGKWTFGESLCRILNPSFTVFSIVTTNTLVAIACDRFRALLFPFKLKPSTSETRLIIAIIWLLAFLVSLPSYGSRTVVDGFCQEVYTSDIAKQKLYSRMYTAFTFLFNNLIPLMVILFLYIKITMALKHITLLPQSFQLNRPSSLAGPQNSPGSSPRNSIVLRNANVAAANKRQRMESKFIRMLLAVVLVFLFCYVPYQVFFLVWEFMPDSAVYSVPMMYANYYLFALMWIPNAINPICYAALNERYAKAFKKLICNSFTRVKKLGTNMPPGSTYTTPGISRRKSSPLSV